MDGIDERPEVSLLLATIRSSLPELQQLLETCTGTWGCEDLVYRFYHQSFKVYEIQRLTSRIVEHLQGLLPTHPLHPWFLAIVEAGTGRKFTLSDNEHWVSVTGPMLEAFFHALYFLQMVCRYGRTLETAPAMLPSGWAAVLSLYRLR